MTKRAATITLLWCLLLPPMSQAGEDYFVLMFGAQQIPNDPNYSHSFATFVRATWPGDEPCPKNPTLQAHTISWLPCSMRVRNLALFPEAGHNVDLHTTLRWCGDNHMRVSLWGAYRICPDLYDRAVKHLNVLESGQVRYKAVDSGRSTDRVSNCIHAIGSVAEGTRLRVGSPGWGEVASYAVLRRYGSDIIDPGQTHPWVGSALGLDASPIIYRDWQAPRSGIFGQAYRLLGGERELRATYGPPSL